MTHQDSAVCIGTSASVGFAALALAAVGLPTASASPPGMAIAGYIDITTYEHYHKNLLYTRLGDNRGFGPQHDLARDNIYNTLQSFGLSVVLEPFVYNSVTYYNVVATQPGTDNAAETVVVGAHFDSVNNPGADDNGTGTALVMELARVLSQHRSSRRIRYVLFDREEQGRKGSIAYAMAHAADNMVFAFTADMVGHDSGSYGMDLYSKATSASVTNGVAAAIGTYGNGLAAFTNFGTYTFSDHYSFEARGIPAVVIIERCYTCNPYYHTANDAVDISPTYISYAMLADLARSSAGYLVDAVPVSLWCDADNDADVDVVDQNAFRACYGIPVSGTCYAFDRDLDGDVDCADWGAFRGAYLASVGQPALPDAAVFTDVLLGTNEAPVDVCMSDVNNDGLLDGLDIAAYTDAALP